jgi:hypothetical protein
MFMGSAVAAHQPKENDMSATYSTAFETAARDERFRHAMSYPGMVNAICEDTAIIPGTIDNQAADACEEALHAADQADAFAALFALCR